MIETNARKTKNNQEILSMQPFPSPSASSPAFTSTFSSAPHLSTAVKVIESVPDIPVLYQEWVKFFHYNDNLTEKPKTFFLNEAYAKQGNSGSKAIPSEKHFFAVVYQDTINFFSSRENGLSQIFDVLPIDFIKTIPENNNYLGGIKNIGTFSEGSCFQVTTVKPWKFFKMTAEQIEPKGVNEIWMICLDKEVEKDKMMDTVIKLKLKKQHSVGAFLNDDSVANLSKSTNTGPTIIDVLKGKRSDINTTDREPIDGYWIILQDWTQCTHKCGGGKQYQQLLCIPEKKGGKPCIGEPVRTRDCNMLPCPTAQTVSGLMPNENKEAGFFGKVEKPVVKVMPISTKPLRYDKCVIKDSDALMITTPKDSQGLTNIAKIPVRITMNNKLFIAYQDENLSVPATTFPLKETNFSIKKDTPSCFVLEGLYNKAEFCRLFSDDSDFITGWEKDFNFFKNQCNTEIKTAPTEEEKKLAQDLKNKIAEIRVDFLRKKMNKAKEKAETNEELYLQKKVMQTQAMTLMAIQKELKLEKLLESEEAQREKEEQEVLRNQIESERKKKECLLKTIHEKEMEEHFNFNEEQTEIEIERIKEEAKRQIVAKRNFIREKIVIMRKKNSRKIAQMQNEIAKIKTETAESLQNVSREGKIENCFSPSTLPDKAKAEIEMEKYCSANFSENFQKFLDCKNKELFCYVCCENEFGEIHIHQRERCYQTKCDITHCSINENKL